MKRKKRNHAPGYTLIEVLIAGAILAISIAAVVAMAVAVSTQQDANARLARAVNFQEQAVRLYQLGLSPSTISALLPPDPFVKSLAFSEEQTVTVGDIQGMERTVCTMICQTGASASDQRTNAVVVLRPTVR